VLRQLQITAPRRHLVLPRAGIRLSLDEADAAGRARDLLILAIAVPWLVYTRLYFVLHPLGLTAALSPFMWLTGKPDPMCGLTRTFAWMWRGDIRQAVLVYPLGPLVFLLTAVAAGYALVALALRMTLRVELRPQTRRLLLSAAAIAIAANWLSKLLWLGM
jgi:hypothetical protein